MKMPDSALTRQLIRRVLARRPCTPMNLELIGQAVQLSKVLMTPVDLQHAGISFQVSEKNACKGSSIN